MKVFGTDPLVYLVFSIGLIFTLILGYATQQTTMMPIFNALILWPFLIWALRHARIDVALRFILLWTAIILVGSIVAGLVLGQHAQAAVPGSVEFNAEHMYWWTGNETSIQQPSLWLPPFLRRIGVTLAGSAFTAGLLPAIFGARSLAILGLWLSNLFHAQNILALPFGLPLWTWAELIGHILLGVVLAEPIVTGDVNALLTSKRKRLLGYGFVALFVALLAHLFIPDLLQPLLSVLVT